MADTIKKLLASAKAGVSAKKDQSLESVAASLVAAVKLAASKATPEQMVELIAQLKKVQRIVLLHHVSLIKPFIGSLEREEPKSEVNEESLKLLEEAVSSKVVDNKRVFLLHRPTADFEYQECIDQAEYKTKEETFWYTTFLKAEASRTAENPVVSAWIPESSIKKIENLQANTGTWGELGENPHADRAMIMVGVGVFTVYSELKS